MKRKGCLVLFFVLPLFLLSAEYTPAAKQNGAGEWRRLESTKYYFAAIKINKVSRKTFHFSISAISGANEEEIQGWAIIKGNSAFYADKEKCRVVFKMAGDALEVKATEKFQWYAGAGVYFGGTYQKRKKVPLPTLQSYGILPTKADERAFRQLTGRDYEHFVDSMASNVEEKDLDGMGAKVFLGSVRGLLGYVGAIIMFRDPHNLWAAVIDGEVVKHYTTVPEFQKKLPAAIEKWREMVPEKKVLFMNASTIPAGGRGK